MVLHWLGYVMVNIAPIFDHLHQFGHLGGSSKHHRHTSLMVILYLNYLEGKKQLNT